MSTDPKWENYAEAFEEIYNAAKLLEGRSLSAGFVAAALNYENNLDGTITMEDEKAAFYSDDVYKTPIHDLTLAGGKTGVDFDALTNKASSYIVGVYSTETETAKFDVLTKAEVDQITEAIVIPYLTVYRWDNDLYILEWKGMARGMSNRLHQRLVKTQRFARESGLAINEETGRKVALTSGRTWNGVNRILLDAFNSETDLFIHFYWDGGAWQQNKTPTQYNNTQYNPNTGLANLDEGKYGINWIFRVEQKTPVCVFVLGEEQYDELAGAQAGSFRGTLPDILLTNAVLVGRIIVLKDATSGDVTSAFVETFAAGPVTTHNALSGLQGGMAGEYYHLTAAEYLAMQGLDPPIGSIIGIHFLAPAPDSEFWSLCDGETWPVGSFTEEGLKPQLTDDRFLMGGSVAGEGGSNTKSLTAANIPSHRHSITHNHAAFTSGSNSVSHSHYFDRSYTSTNGGNITWQKGASGAPNYRQTTSSQSANHTHSINVPNFSGYSGYYGSGTAFDILPKYFKVKFYIRYK